jgi:hypothetical protein
MPIRWGGKQWWLSKSLHCPTICKGIAVRYLYLTAVPYCKGVIILHASPAGRWQLWRSKSSLLVTKCSEFVVVSLCIAVRVSESATPHYVSLGRREGVTGSPTALVFLSEFTNIRRVVVFHCDVVSSLGRLASCFQPASGVCGKCQINRWAILVIGAVGTEFRGRWPEVRCDLSTAALRPSCRWLLSISISLFITDVVDVTLSHNSLVAVNWGVIGGIAQGVLKVFTKFYMSTSTITKLKIIYVIA